MNFQMFKLVLEKAEEPEIKLPTSAGSSKKVREFQKNIYFCFIDYAKDFDSVDHNKLWKMEWQPTPVFLPEEFHGQRSLTGRVHGVAKSQTQLRD